MVATAVPERQPEALLSWMASLADPTRLRLLRLLERARARGGAAVRDPPASAVDGEPAPEGAGRRGLRPEPGPGDEPALSHGADGKRRRGPPAVAPGPRRDRAPGRPCVRMLSVSRGSALDRRPPAQAFFAGASGKWDRLREEAYGRTLNQSAILALLPPTGWWPTSGAARARSPLPWPRTCARVIGVDQSAAMLKAAPGTHRGPRQRRPAQG